MNVFQNSSPIIVSKTQESGFIILIVPILLVLFGFFVSAMLNETKPNQFYFETTTQQTMESTQKVLAAYAHRNYRVPCPADPVTGTGTEVVTAAGACDMVKGILPYKTLGLSESAARDEWGHLLTYKVSPGFAGIVQASDFVEAGDTADEALLIADSNSESFVHQMCQTAAWKDSSNSYVKTDGNSFAVADPYNINVFKARFCCPSNVSGGGVGVDDDSTTIMAVDAKPAADAAGVGVMSIELTDGINFGVESFDDLSAIMPIANNYWVGESEEEVDIANGMIDFTYHEPETDPALQGFGHIGAEAWGGFYPSAPVMSIDITKHDVKEAEFNYQDVFSNNWNAPLQISLEVYDPTDPSTVVDKIEYAIQMPTQEYLPLAEQDGKVDVMISIKDILGDPNDPKLFNQDHILGKEYFDRVGREYPTGAYMYAADGRILFDKNRAEFIDALVSKGLISEADRADSAKLEAAAEMLQIGKIKLNPAGLSMAFGSMTFGKPGAPVVPPSTNTNDIQVLNEADMPRLAKRGDSTSYSDASEGEHIGPINQDYEAVAYALISHGVDGEGAYLIGGAQVDNILNANENIFELENAYDNVIVRDVRKIISDDPLQKFDDIVMWDSQITLYNSIRSGTCEFAQSL